MNELEPQAVATTPLETPAAPVGEAPVETPADDSLAAHEAAHGPERPERTDAERDETGKFVERRSRRRAESQRADADDVPAINELTKRLKAAEETAGKDIVRKDGESERVFTLRRRAELAERAAAPPKPAAQPQPAYQPPSQSAPQSQQQLAQAFPEYDDILQIPGNENVTFNQYLDARARWVFAQLREQERAAEANDRQQREYFESGAAHNKRVSAARATKYPDWDTVVTNDIAITQVIERAILGSDKSDDIQYHLGKHRDVLAALNAESQEFSPSAVAAMRRYLDTLVAPATSSPPSTRAAAGSTGAALALAPKPAPKPPTPVRTGTMTTADDPPDDDSQSLAAHEQHFGKKRRA